MNQADKQNKIKEQQSQYPSEAGRMVNKVKRKFVSYEPPSLIAKIERENPSQKGGEDISVQEQRNRIMQQYQQQLWRRVGEIINQKDQSRMRNLQLQLQQKIRFIQQIANQNKESRERQMLNERRQMVQKKQHQKLLLLFQQLQTRYNECEKKLKQSHRTCEQQQEQLIENRNKFIDMEAKLQNLQGINQSISVQLKLKIEQLQLLRNSYDQLHLIKAAHQQSNKRLSDQLGVVSEQILKLKSTLVCKQQALDSAKNQFDLKAIGLYQANKALQGLRQQNIRMAISVEQLTLVNQQLRVKIQNTDISKNLAEQLRSKIEELIQLRKINQNLQRQILQHNQSNQISKIQIDKLKQITVFQEEKSRQMQGQILRINQKNGQIQNALNTANLDIERKTVEIELQRSKTQQMLMKIKNLQEINKSIAQQFRLKIESIIEIRKITEEMQSKQIKKQQQILNLKSLLNPSPQKITFQQSPFISIAAIQPIIQQRVFSISSQYSQAISCPLQQLDLARFVSDSSAPSSEHFLQQRQKYSDKSQGNSRQKSAFRVKSDYHRSQSIDSIGQVKQQFDYRNIQAKCMLLQKQLQLKSNEFLTISQLLHQKQNELYSMRQQFQNYSNLINQLRKRIQQLQKQPIIYHRPIQNVNLQQKMNHWHQLINNINRNCLKNNCDSTGIINIQLNGIQQKAVIDFINLSPTDIDKFNKKQDNVDFNDDHNYGVNARGQNEAYHLYRSDDSLDPRKEVELKENGSFSRKISVQSDNYAEKEAAANKIALQKENELRICHTQSEQVHNTVPAPTSPSKQNEVSQCGENGKSLSICNNANSQFKLTYQQLNQKCLRIQRENEKMWEYLRLLHGLNHKWKKSSAEIDHQSKINVLGKLSEKVNNLLQRDRFSENQQLAANQLGNLIKDVQNYIHFLDHLIKIQPFQDGHRTPYHAKKPQATSENNANHLYSKKTYSQGCCRQDDYIQNFDIYPYEIEQIPRQDLRKEVEKKQLFEMEKFNNQEKKDWFSEISSVKNQSQSEMSKSELIQLQMYMRGNFIREEADSFKEAKRDHNDSSKAEHKSFSELRQMYQKLRDQYEQLLRQKNGHEKIYRKQMQRIQSEYIKKMGKMTKDFNDTFGLLCQRSGLHKRQRPVQKQCYHREIQVDLESAPMMRKKSHSRTSFQDREVGMKTQQMVQIATQQLQFQLKESQQKLKESSLAQQKYKENIVDMQKKLSQRQQTIDKLSKWLTVQKKNEEILQSKFTLDFQEFIQKIIIKNKANDVSQDINDKGKLFRKSVVSNASGEYINATKISQVKISSEYIIRTILQSMDVQGEQLKDNISEEQFKVMITDRMDKYRKTTVNKVIMQLVHKIESLIHYEEQQRLSMKNWAQAFQQYTDYDQLSIKSLSDLCEQIFKKSHSTHYLPINSKSNSEESCNGEKHLMLYSRNSETQLKKQLQQQRQCNQLIKKEKNELSDMINRLQSDMKSARKQLKIQQQSYSTLVANNPFEGMMHEKEKEIIQLQQEIMALREQSTRMKLKSKKGKIFRIDH